MIGPVSLLLCALVGSTQPTAVAVRTHSGPCELRFADPTAKQCAVTDAAGAQAGIVSSRVVVQPKTGTGLSKQVIRCNPKMLDALTNSWVIECDTVAEAAALADQLAADDSVQDAWIDMGRPVTLRSGVPTDPFLGSQWHLINALAPLEDANVDSAWALGYTGAGLTVGITELGFIATHPDIAANFNSAASQAAAGETTHGTSVAGIVAAVGNNGLGGAGLAYGARVSRQYVSTPTNNFAAFTFFNSVNAVKNNSWGPPDNGRIHTIASIEVSGMRSAAQSGRLGLGTVLVWAAGNGGAADRVDYDPFASSRFTIAVNGLDEFGGMPTYNEQGSSVFMCAPSSGASPARGIFTLAGTSGFTSSFGQTSAASPMVSGAAALVLEANPMLTARDVMHVFADTVRPVGAGDPSWITNGAGRMISSRFGFGALDAGAAVAYAETFSSVGPELSVHSPLFQSNAPITDQNPTGTVQTWTTDERLRIEHVELTLSIAHNSIGDLRIRLISPAGTESIFSIPRNDPTANLSNHTFTTNRCWDEDVRGTWQVQISDEGTGAPGGRLTNWRLSAFGTARATCPCDADGSGSLDTMDFMTFVGEFMAGEADFDGSGRTDSSDFYAFLGCFFSPPEACESP